MALGTSEITTTLVATTIGEVTNDVGALCRSNKINKWSRFKPVNYPSIVGIYGSSGNDSTIITSLNYGLSASVSSNYKTSLLNPWIYAARTSPYRLGDFRNYNHLANPPIIFKNSNKTVNRMYASSLSISALIAMEDDAFISIFDLPLIKDYYFGAVIVTESEDAYPVTSNVKLSSGGNIITLDMDSAPFDSIEDEELIAYVSCFKNTRAQNSVLGSNSYIALPSDNTGVMVINVINTVGLTAVSTRVSVEDSPPFTEFNTTRHYILAAIPPLLDRYLLTAGAVFFELKLTNATGADIPFNLNSLTMNFTNTLNRDTPTSLTPKVYIDDVLTTGIVNIPVGEFIEVVIGHDRVLGWDSSNNYYTPVSGVQKTINISLVYRSVNAVIGFGAIRFQGE